MMNKKQQLIDDLKKEDNLDIWWTVSDEWMDLSYEKKAEHYWLYKHDDKGNRITND